ncbi:unnamed protein product [Pylaiella littoralis]
MNSYLTAVVLLIAAAIQADAFTGSLPLTGVRSTVNQRGAVFKMELSPYEEYMASRGGSAPAPAAPAASTPSAPARVSSPSAPASSKGKWQPRAKPSWKSSPSSRGGVSSPAVSSPSAPAAYSPPAPTPSARAAAPEPATSAATGAGHVGSGGMADTRDPTPVNHEDPRKSISAAPSFEEYLKSRG